MTLKGQMELFKDRDWESEFIAAIDTRLPKKPFLSVSEAAEVMDKSNTTIIAFCEQGDLIAAPLGTGERREWTILTASIPALYQRRLNLASRPTRIKE